MRARMAYTPGSSPGAGARKDPTMTPDVREELAAACLRRACLKFYKADTSEDRVIAAENLVSHIKLYQSSFKGNGP